MIRFVSRLMMIASIIQVTACTVLQKPTPEVVTSEIVYHDSTILTMESGQPLAQAILIQGDTITAVGNDAEVLAQAGPGARVYDMQGQTIVPGFIDTHNHRIAWSLVGGDYETPEAAIQAALEQGWTGLHELDVNSRLLDTLVTLDAQDQLRLRVAGYLAINSPVWDKSIGDQIFEYEPTIYSPNLRISGVKVFMKEGSQFYKDQEELNQLLPPLHEAGWQIAIEAIESQTLEVVLSSLEGTLQGNHNDTHRHRIEHAIAMTDKQLARMAALGIIASVQLNVPVSLIGDPSLTQFLAQEPEDRVARWRDLIETDVMTIGNTDFPSIDIENNKDPPPGSPIRLLHRAARATWPGEPAPAPWMRDQAITVEQALRLMTINAAYSTFEEDTRGSLAPGKLADMVILSANPLSTPIEELLHVEVLATIVGGKVEWCKHGYESLCPVR